MVNFKKILISTLVMSMSCLSVVGCGFNTTPRTASDVIEKYNKANYSNWAVDGQINLNIDVKTQGLTFNIPVSVNYDMDVADSNIHGNLNLEMEALGESKKISTEFYADGDTYYVNADNSGWVKERAEDVTQISEITKKVSSKMNADIFKDADMTHNSSAETYVITQPVKALLDSGNFREFLGSDYSDSSGIDIDDVIDKFGQADVVWTFDKDCTLISMQIKDMSYSATVDADGSELDFKINFDVNMGYSDYGKIDINSVKVPDDIKNSATTVNDTDSENNLLNGSDILPVPDSSNITSTTAAANNGTVSGSLQPNATIPSSTQKQNTNYGSKYGTYNGTKLSVPFDVNILLNDGWTFDMSSDGQYSFAVLENNKYKDCEIYVFGKSDKGLSSEIKSGGVYGYSVECTYASVKPNMTFNGITWGAQADDILAAYGSPLNVYNGSSYTSYEFTLDSDTDITYITFYVYPGKGLQQVDLDVYTFN